MPLLRSPTSWAGAVGAMAALLCGCPAPEPADAGPSDAGAADAGGGDAGQVMADGGGPTFVFANRDDVRLALGAIDLPYFAAFTATPNPDFGVTCPVSTRTSFGWTSQGGCTDAQGTTWSGSVVVHQTASAMGALYTFDYAAFSGDGGTWGVTLDGTIVATVVASSCGLPGPQPLEANGLHAVVSGDAVQGFGGFFPGAGRSVELSYVQHRYAWDGVCAPALATLTARGEVELGGRGRVAFDMTRGDDSSCRHDPTSGSIAFTGANTATLTYDGATACDGCLPWQAAGGLTGTLCWQ
ncbi:MAG: hypothetical protein IPJ65_04600 [Archangiaceae bacterium]|nr:hypothetical protein [Archangiaceae bacterium]